MKGKGRVCRGPEKERENDFLAPRGNHSAMERARKNSRGENWSYIFVDLKDILIHYVLSSSENFTVSANGLNYEQIHLLCYHFFFSTFLLSTIFPRGPWVFT